MRARCQPVHDRLNTIAVFLITARSPRLVGRSLALPGLTILLGSHPRPPRQGRCRGERDRSAGPGGVGMSRRIERHHPLCDQLTVHAEQRADRAMESASPNMAGRMLLGADLAQSLGLALGMLEGVA
jgi:hypothetical protein